MVIGQAAAPCKRIPPVPPRIVTEVVPVTLPNVLTLAPVVANVVAPTEERVVVAAMDPGAMKVDGTDQVTVDPEAAVVISLEVPEKVMTPEEAVAVPLSASTVTRLPPAALI